MQLLSETTSDEPSVSYKKIVDLIIISPNDANMPLNLVSQLQEVLDDGESRGNIIRTFYPSLKIIAVTVEVEENQFGNLMIKLAYLSEVERLDGEIKAQEEFSSSPAKYVGSTKSDIEPTEKIYIILKEPDVIASN